MKHLNEKNFANETKAGIVLLDLFATWCGPCRIQSAVLEEVVKARPDMNIAKVDVDENPNIARNFGVMSIPTLILLKDGKMVNKHVGLMQSDDLIKFYDSVK